jgi:hypothetical protein
MTVEGVFCLMASRMVARPIGGEALSLGLYSIPFLWSLNFVLRSLLNYDKFASKVRLKRLALENLK